MSPWLYGLGGSLIAGMLLGWTVRDWKSDSDQLAAKNAADKRYDAQAAELADQSRRFEELAQAFRANERVDRTIIQEKFREIEVPAECAVPDDIASLLGSAVRDANAAAAGEPIGPMPSTSPSPDAID